MIVKMQLWGNPAQLGAFRLLAHGNLGFGFLENGSLRSQWRFQSTKSMKVFTYTFGISVASTYGFTNIFNAKNVVGHCLQTRVITICEFYWKTSFGSSRVNFFRQSNQKSLRTTKNPSAIRIHQGNLNTQYDSRGASESATKGLFVFRLLYIDQKR